MADGRTRRMHAVPRSYFDAFAVHEPGRRASRVWRFDRIFGESKLVGVGDTEVVKDIYAVFSDDGTPDTAIEDDMLCGIEDAFCSARSALLNRTPLSKDHWIALARFVAAQLLRTPRFLQLVRDGLDADGTVYERDTPQRVMVVLIERWVPRLLRMTGIIARNETGFPLLTSDNPAVLWKQSRLGDGFMCGVDQYDPDLVVSCPLGPTLMFAAYQTPQSLNSTWAERRDVESCVKQSRSFATRIAYTQLTPPEVKRFNNVCISNANNYIYANYCDGTVLRFLQNRFFGAPAPVRRRDLRPIGSPPAEL